jgi:uncharacterized surface protein with fasciclin (FAS1) repeats
MSSKSAVAEKNLVQIAQGNPDFSTLVKALIAADLVSTLEGSGPFTIFAPTNEAFAKVPPATIKELLKPENKAKLASILTYHVLPGKFEASKVKAGKVKTVNGKELNIAVNGSEVKINNSRVIKTDIIGSNGVIHVIDTVLMPS